MSEVKSSLAEVALVQAVFVLEDFLEESGKKKSDTEVLTELGGRSKLGLIPRASSLTRECGKTTGASYPTFRRRAQRDSN